VRRTWFIRQYALSEKNAPTEKQPRPPAQIFSRK